MKVEVSWDGPSADEPERGNTLEIGTLSELEVVLDKVAAQASREHVPYAVQIHNADAPGSIMIGIGHERSFVDWLDTSGRRISAHDPSTPLWSGPVGFDVYGNWHEYEPTDTRVTEPKAREVARQYVATGRRPASLEWH